MVGKSEFGLHNGLSLLAFADSLSELLWVLIEEEERKTSYELILTRRDNLDLVLLLFVVIVKDPNWPPDVLFVFKNWRQCMRLVRPCLAVINPLFNRFILLPSVVTGESFDAWHVRVPVKNFIFLLQDFECLLSGLILICGSIKFFDEGPFSDDVFVLFNNISMSGRQALF